MVSNLFLCGHTEDTGKLQDVIPTLIYEISHNAPHYLDKVKEQMDTEIHVQFFFLQKKRKIIVIQYLLSISQPSLLFIIKKKKTVCIFSDV